MVNAVVKLAAPHECLDCEDGSDGTSAGLACETCHGTGHSEEAPIWRGASMSRLGYSRTPPPTPLEQVQRRKRPGRSRPRVDEPSRLG
jgi:hypothetical protein